MRRRILMGILALGSVLGFSLGIAHLRHHSCNSHRNNTSDCADHGRNTPADETR